MKFVSHRRTHHKYNDLVNDYYNMIRLFSKRGLLIIRSTCYSDVNVSSRHLSSSAQKNQQLLRYYYTIHKNCKFQLNLFTVRLTKKTLHSSVYIKNNNHILLYKPLKFPFQFFPLNHSNSLI